MEFDPNERGKSDFRACSHNDIMVIRLDGR